MCRWLAYSGPPIYLESLIFKPEHSLVDQSRRAHLGASVTNGDGFGVGWYGERPEPGVFRDTRPAWNDENLHSLSQQVRAGTFFAHVRASTGTATERANCHPFRHGSWLFMHNGYIGGFERIRRALAFAVAPALYPRIAGTTDSEAFFYLLLTNGLMADPAAAFAASVGQVLALMAEAGVDEPFKMTAAASDGRAVTALRFASDGAAPSLFYGCGVKLRDGAGAPVEPAGNSVLILSEPLDHVEQQWIAVPESHLLAAGDGGIAVTPFAPRAVPAAA
ncbi:MAG: class II glutamine amidotransferase [Rhodospirillales bacterium]|nr:class II glutamine amidotransferase [Rhodospirillales bacterium]